VGLAHDKSASWVDLAHSDRVVVVVDLHVAKIEAAMGLCAVKQRQWQGLARLEGQGIGVGITWWRDRRLRTWHVG